MLTRCKENHLGLNRCRDIALRTPSTQRSSATICGMREDSTPGSAGVEPTRPDPVLSVTGDFAAPDPIRVATEDALAAAQQKQAAARARLAEAHDEAQTLIRDATNQAMLVAAAAER